MIEQIISILAPHECISCRREGRLLCDDCRRALPSADVDLAWSYPGSVTVATFYKGPAKDIIQRVKFGRAKAGISDMAAVIAERLVFPPDCIVCPVPTASSRERVRGYDQAVLLAREVAKRQRLRYVPLLERMGQQRQLGNTRHRRQVQMEHAFRPINLPAALHSHVVLIDDVITTGSTLHAAAKVLTAAGVTYVSARVFARAQ